MDKDQIAEMIRRRLKLDDQEWAIVKQNPKFQRLFKNAIEASHYRLVAEVIDSKGCHSGHVIGQKLISDNFRKFTCKRESGSCLFFLDAKLSTIDQCFF